MFHYDKKFEHELLATIKIAADREWVPQIAAETRVDTSALQASTRTILDEEEPALYLAQGGVNAGPFNEFVDYAAYVELRFGDFSSSVARLSLDFG